MNAIQVVGPQRLQLIQAPEPKPQKGEVLVRMDALSVCGTDMRLFRHPQKAYPMAPGMPSHECAGTIVESRLPGWKEGQRVIFLPRLNLNGGAEYVVGGPDCLVALPDDGDVAEWLMCQPWGTVLFALERIGSVEGKRVVVLGQGSIGLLFTRSLRHMGVRQLITADLLAHRLAWSRRLGADLAIDAQREDVVGAVAEATQGRGADLVIEASGDPQALGWAIRVARMYATVLLFGIPEEDRIAVDYFPAMAKQLVLVSAVSATCDDPARPIRLAVEMKQQDGTDLSWLVTHRLSFQDAPRAYQMYARREDDVLKVVMEVNHR